MTAPSQQFESTDSARFPTTRWSIVVQAGNLASMDSRDALATLCKDYREPVYAFVRRKVAAMDDAEDLTQEFFAELVERGGIGDPNPEFGRFRFYLLGAVKHFLSRQRERRQAEKRGGGRARVSLDCDQAKDCPGFEAVDPRTPEQEFHRRWALTLIENSLCRLRHWCQKRGKLDRFEALKPFLQGNKAGTYREVADELGVSEDVVKQEVRRLRRKYAEVLRDLIATTTARPEHVDEELRDLFEAVRR